MAQHERYLIT